MQPFKYAQYQIGLKFLTTVTMRNVSMSDENIFDIYTVINVPVFVNAEI